MTIISSSLRCNVSNLRAAPESVCHSLKTRRRDWERQERQRERWRKRETDRERESERERERERDRERESAYLCFDFFHQPRL